MLSLKVERSETRSADNRWQPSWPHPWDTKDIHLRRFALGLFQNFNLYAVRGVSRNVLLCFQQKQTQSILISLHKNSQWEGQNIRYMKISI